MHRRGQEFRPCERQATGGRSRSADGIPPRDRSRELQIVLTTLPSLHSDRGKENGESAVKHNDEKDRLDDRDRRLLSKRFRASLDSQALAACNDADYQRHERRLDHADLEMRHGYGFMKPCDEYRRTHPAVEPRDQPPAVESGHRTNECEDRKRQDQGDNSWKYQDFNGIEAHGG